LSTLITNTDPNNFAIAFSGTTSTESFITEQQTSVLLTAADNDRKKLVIINESNRNFFMSFNSPAGVQQGIVMAPGDMWVEEHYTGAVYGVWSNGANKGARIFVIK
jgi:hypothetical protein